MILRATIWAMIAAWFMLGWARYPAKGQEGYLHLDPAEVRANAAAKAPRLTLDAYQRRRAVTAHKRVPKPRPVVAPKPIQRIPDLPIEPPRPAPTRKADFARILPMAPTAFGMRPADVVDQGYQALAWRPLPAPVIQSERHPINWPVIGMGILFAFALGTIVLWPYRTKPERRPRHYPSDPIIIPRCTATVIQFGNKRRKIA